MQEEKEKTKKERKTATIVWSCCRLASPGRLTLLLRLFESKREKMRTPNVISTVLAYTYFCLCAQAYVPTDAVSETETVVVTSKTIR